MRLLTFASLTQNGFCMYDDVNRNDRGGNSFIDSNSLIEEPAKRVGGMTGLAPLSPTNFYESLQSGLGA